MKKIPNLKINIRNQSGEEAVIDIDGEIGWVNENGEWNTAASIKSKLKEISELEAKKIIVNINSLGGFVDDGLAIHDVLASHKAEIETHVIGMTASAATVVAQAGDKRFMSDNALYLIHQAWGLAIGNANDMLAVASDLEAIDSRILNIYMKRSGKNESDIQKLMGENNGGGKWIDADEALELGLIDEAFEPMKAAASASVNDIRNAGLPIPEGMESTATIKVNADELLSELDSRIDFLKDFQAHRERQEGLKDQITKEHDSKESDEVVPEGITLEEARNREIETIIQ